MAHHDIVVLGASAGGVSALAALVNGLPEDLPATLFFVVHVPPYAVSQLPEILCRAGPLPAVHASDGMPIRAGQIIVAPPNRHLLVRQGHVELSRGPRENPSRPAIDPLFRSAARAYGGRVIGVILSGAPCDGSLGLMAVKMRGGVVIVQDPREAMIDSMPRTALKLVEADYVLGAAEIASVIAELARTPAAARRGATVIESDEPLEAVIASDFAEQAHDQRAEETTVYTCPDCGGVLWQDGTRARLSFR